MKTQHTKGPWEADIHMGNNGYEIADMIEPSICEMVSVHSPEETKANARLIAASPCLLEALKDVFEAMKHNSEFGSFITLPDGRTIQPFGKVVAAIAKAEGEQ